MDVKVGFLSPSVRRIPSKTFSVGLWSFLELLLETAFDDEEGFTVEEELLAVLETVASEETPSNSLFGELEFDEQAPRECSFTFRFLLEMVLDLEFFKIALTRNLVGREILGLDPFSIELEIVPF